MTGQSNLMQEDAVTSKNDPFCDNDDVVFRHKKQTRNIKNEQNDRSGSDSRIFFGDITKHRQATVYEIDVDIKLEDYNSFSLLSETKHKKLHRAKQATSSYVSDRDGVENENKQEHAGKYSSQTIAKILHTKQRIRRILDMQPDIIPERSFSIRNSQNLKTSSEKSPRLSKFAHQYLFTSKPKSNVSSFYSLPNSNGSIKGNFSPRSTLTLKRTKSDVSQHIKHLSLNPDSQWLNIDLESLIGGQTDEKQNNNYSSVYKNESLSQTHKKNLSQNRYTSLLCATPSHLVASSAHEISINNNYDSLLSTTPIKDRDPNPFHTHLQEDQTKNKFSSLKRRFSKKSQSKSKNSSRNSIAADELLSTRHSDTEEIIFSPRIRKRKDVASFRKSQKSSYKTSDPEIDQMKVFQPQRKNSADDFKQRRSIKERFADFMTKKSPSLTRRSTLKKERESSKALNKSLSSSSPQLSAHAINKKPISVDYYD